jgi:phospholipid/cholesterol/gamma-HCH transport system substrate-binding protein
MSEFYKDQRKVEIRVGIVVVLSVIILIIGYAWLRNALQLKAMTELKIRFDNAQGLQIGDKVTVNGMETGRVQSIAQLPDGVLVESQIRLKYPLRQGARFVIQDSNLMGGKQLDIINSTEGDPLDTKLVLDGENSSGMTALLGTASTTMQQINVLLTELNKPDGVFSQVRQTFNETKATFTKVNNVIDGSKDNINNALKQISESAQQLNELISQNKSKLENAVNLTPGLIQKTQSTLDSLQAASSTLQSAVKEITAGKGTLPSLINDDKLYKSLLDSSARLDSLLIDVKKNPTRYFKVKVF